MKIIINNSSMIPIYTQIVEQVKSQIAAGKLKDNDPLPSVRTLSGELKISALTVKKAYDELESQGFVVTVHGKGTYVSGSNSEYIRENQIKEVENDLRKVIDKAVFYNISKEELKEIWNLLNEE